MASDAPNATEAAADGAADGDDTLPAGGPGTVSLSGEAQQVPRFEVLIVEGGARRAGAPAEPHARFAVRGELARGGIGRILLADDRSLDRQVAIKEPLDHDADTLARFAREVRVTARLEHPGIVSVHEAGRWPDGRPFYVMRLVPGRTLEQAVAATAGLGERLALLPRVLAAAEAIAYAHGQGIVHRDLKPANVLVGDFGETVVIDWGLAKFLAESSEPAAPARPAPAAAADATGVGDVVGTPAFMAPEQARGRPVDARADVYALGAILYRVLAGAAPYAGGNARAVIARVLAGGPRPLEQAAPGCPRDLAAIAAQAMARDPADRYPSARELADDLSRFQTGQLVAAHRYRRRERVARFARRHRGAVAIGLALGAALVAVSTWSLGRVLRERDRAEQAAATAERRRGDAETLVEFMLGDLRKRLDAIGRLDAMAGVGTEVVDYYERLAAEGELGDSQEHRRATALFLLGDAALARGDVAAARRAFGELVTVRRALAAAAPRDPARLDELGRAIERVGGVEEEDGQLDAALRHYREALALVAVVGSLPGADEQWRADHSTLWDHVGTVLRRQGDLAGCRAAYERSLRLATEVAADYPDNRILRRQAELRRITLADAQRQQGDLDAARAGYREAIAALSALVASESSQTGWLGDLATARARLARVLRSDGDLAGALAEADACIAEREAILRVEPGNAVWVTNLALDLSLRGDLLADQGHPMEALAAYEHALTVIEPIAGAEAGATRRGNLTSVLGRVGAARLAVGDTGGALAAHQRALAIQQELAAAAPDDARLAGNLAVRWENIAQVRLAAHDDTGAIAALRESLALLEPLIAAAPDNVERRSDLAYTRYELAVVLARRPSGEAEARTLCDEALAALDPLAAAGQLTKAQAKWPGQVHALRDRLAEP